MKINEELLEILDEQFPKGECKERGNALILFAEADNQIFKAYEQGKSSAIKEVLEIFEPRIIQLKNFIKSCDAGINEKCYSCLINKQLLRELENIKAKLQEKTA